LTVIIPIIFFLILKNLGVIHSIFLPTLEERKYPLYISCILFLMILYKVIPNNYVNELFYFFTGLLTATATALILLFLKFKTSMHLLGMGSILMFMIGLSIHFEVNITLAISIFTLFTGLVTTSRLYLKAHSKSELFIGFLIGCCSQLIILKYWL
jgi:membrane-associated phospholipid phosphatase